MKKRKSHAIGAFAMAAVLTAQLLAAPLSGVFAAEDNTDTDLAYFVDCGDFDTSTLSEGDKFGIYNTVTDQPYGKDPGTGKTWGIVDSISEPLKNGTSNSAPKAAYTDNTWPNEWMTGDGVEKTQSSRYTKNQFENGMPRVLDYSFELPNGTYTVELFFADPWGVSTAPTAAFEETVVVKDIITLTESRTEVTVNDGFLDIHITSESACINLAYIKIYQPGAATGTTDTDTNTGEITMTDFTTYNSYELSQVDVTDAYLTNAEDKDIAYLLSLDADRLLAGFRETAGVDMKGAKRYAGWETSLIAGHTLGHYLTAVAQAVATLPAEDSRDAELNDRLNYLIDSLKECQDALGTGFLFGATVYNKNNLEFQFDNVEKNKTNITTEAWVPWYTMHKILAGIIDVYKYTGNETALEVAKNLGTWVYNRTQTWSSSTRRTVLNIEYGGMNDCLYELYAVTGEDIYAIAAHDFDEDTLFQAVEKGAKDVLTNRHANTTIPKFIGALNRYVATHGKTIDGEVVDASKYLEYAQLFFDMVLTRHSYVTGDNSEWEHFGSDYILDAERTNCNCETCNAYNMLKFAKALYMATGDTAYLNYYENTFYNTILSSQNPESGMTTYFQPMATGYFKVYTTATGSFWCCTGSGMENFTKLGNAIYYSGKEGIVVSQYLSSVLTDETKNVLLTMTADIPASDKVSVLVNTLDGSAEVKESILLRLPGWLAEEASVVVSGSDVSTASIKMTEEYAIVSGLKNGNTIELTLPMNITVHGLPDNDSVFAFKYGPIVLSAKLGSTNMATTYTGVSVLIPAAKLIEETYISDGNDTISVINGSVADFMTNINTNLVKTDGELSWTLENTDANLTFVPHYSQHTERYGIYFNYESNSGAFNVSRYLRELEDNRFTAALLDTVQPGYGQYENDELHNMTEAGTGSTGATSNGTSRLANAGGSFIYTMYVDPDCDNALELTLKKEDNGKSLQILVGEEVVYNETLAYTGNEEEYTIRIPVAKDILAKAATELKELHPTTGKTAYTAKITFTSGNDEASARICNYLYMTKAYAANTGFTLSADAGELTKDGSSYKLVLPEEAETVTLTATPEDAFGYLRVNGAVARDTYTLDMTVSNFLTLEYTVYGEDHETSAVYTVSIEQPVANRTDVDNTLAYFVNCGDYDVTTLSDGDLFGIYNGVTEQVYGVDPVTGKTWGIVDTISNPLKNGTANNAAMTNTVFTDNTWTFETNATLSDSSPKTATNRYTKNQYENGIARNLNYKFELPNGKYTVELYFTDPWNCSKNPIVSLEGFQVLKNVAMNKAVTAEVLVEDGELNLAITAPNATLCLNLCYIKIYLPEDAVVTPEPTPTEVPATPTPVPTEVPVEPATEPMEAPAEPTAAPATDDTASDNNSTGTDTADKNTSADTKGSSALPLVAGGAAVIGAIAGVVAYFMKKRKK